MRANVSFFESCLVCQSYRCDLTGTRFIARSYMERDELLPFFFVFFFVVAGESNFDRLVGEWHASTVAADLTRNLQIERHGIQINTFGDADRCHQSNLALVLLHALLENRVMLDHLWLFVRGELLYQLELFGIGQLDLVGGGVPFCVKA